MRRARPLEYLLAASLFVLPALGAAKPFRIPYETEKAFGYDGPWNAIKASIGNPPQLMHFFPARFLGIYLFNSTVCDEYNSDFKDCLGTETYDQTKSKGWNKEIIDPDNQVARNGFLKATKYGYFMNDMTYNYQEYTSVTEEPGAGNGMKYTLTDAHMAFIAKASVTFPGGLKVPPPLGYYTYGGPDDRQMHNKEFSGSLVMNQMQLDDLTPSRTMGLHIGSALLGQQGSFIFGGYDKSRIASPPTSYGMKINDQFTLDLFNISLKYMDGKTRDQDTVVARSQTFEKGSVSLYVDPTWPYMYLPSDICSELTERLPVTYDPSLGLYIWDTSNKKYKSFVNAPHYLEFTFPSSKSNKIRVPLKLLSLQLGTPLVKSTKRYFPCRPISDEKAEYTLGRAFLQAAYLAYNRHTSVFWLGQAVGPGGGMTQRSEDMVPLEKDSVSLKPANGDASVWESSWAAVWDTADKGDAPEYTKVKGPSVKFEDPKATFDSGIDDPDATDVNKKIITGTIEGIVQPVLNGNNENGGGNGGTSGPGDSTDGTDPDAANQNNKDAGEKKSSSIGAIVGGAVGGVAGAAILVAIILLICRRRKKRPERTESKWGGSQWGASDRSSQPWPPRPGSDYPGAENFTDKSQQPMMYPPPTGYSGHSNQHTPYQQYPDQQHYPGPGYGNSDYNTNSSGYEPNSATTESRTYQGYPTPTHGGHPGMHGNLGPSPMNPNSGARENWNRTPATSNQRYHGFQELDTASAPVEIGGNPHTKPVELDSLQTRQMPMPKRKPVPSS